MGTHHTATASRVTVFGARALTAAAALTLLGGGAGVAMADQGHDKGDDRGHHQEHRGHDGGTVVNDSPQSESTSSASVVSMPEIDLSQDQDNEQDVEQAQEQEQEQEQTVEPPLLGGLLP